MSQVSVLFVCLGNICRSPTAEGVFRGQVERAGLAENIRIDSAGTGAWHVGNPPDHRATAHAGKRGYDLASLRARQVIAADFNQFDYILAMDGENLAELKKLRLDHYRGHLGLFLEFGTNNLYREVPDPYYGGDAGFELVLDLVESAAQGLLAAIRNRYL